MAPLTRRQKKALAAELPPPVIDPARPPPVIEPTDRISKLPKEIQEHILSFLPAQEAVRTCVIARTWRHVWKSTRRLLITSDCRKSVQKISRFVDHLLRIRLDGLKVASLDASDIRFDPREDWVEYWDDVLYSEDMSILNGWICRLLECQIQMLRVSTARYNDYHLLVNSILLVSRHLTRLELTSAEFDCRRLNLDGCPVLEHLEMNDCYLDSLRKMRSLSLKRLVIRSCFFTMDQKRIQICVPRLVSLWLEHDGRTPMLQRMPELVGAKVWINSYGDKCDCDDPMACYHVKDACNTLDIDSDSDDDEEGFGEYAGQNTTKCVVLEGLAQARDLILIADNSTYILRRDLRWCPTFSNLKTLVLIEEYRHEPAGCRAIECMLEHAPLLEKLTLILKKVPRDGKNKVEIKGYPDAKVTSNKISRHLQIVEIICEGVNVIFVNVLNLLDTLNICFKTRVTEYMP